MKLLTFNYKDANGKDSERVLLTISEPTNKFFGYDLTEMDPIDADNLYEEIERAHQIYLDQINRLMGLYDNNYKVRSFLQERMSNVCEI